MAQSSAVLSDFSAKVFFHGKMEEGHWTYVTPRTGHLHLLLSGSATFEHDGGRVQADVPTLMLYPRPCAHTVVVPAAARLLCAEIVTPGQPEDLDDLPAAIEMPLADLAGADGVLARLAMAPAGGGARSEESCRLVDWILVHLLRQWRAGGIASNTPLPRDAGVAKALLAMQREPGEAWTVATLAALCGMSRSKFARRFREAVGATPAEYLLGQRIRMAKCLLQRGRQVQDVACEVGYSTQPAFTRAFRAACRVSPREWLQSAA